MDRGSLLVFPLIMDCIDPNYTRPVIPDFPVACRRLTPGPGYLEALGEDNVCLYVVAAVM